MAKDISKQVEELDEVNRKKSLRYSIYDANAYSVMYGFGETYITPFAVALKATAQQIGFLSSIPTLLSSFFQLYAGKVTDRLKNRKKITLISVFLQAIVFLPLLLIPFMIDRHNILMLTILFSLYWIFGQFAGPAWSSWMGDLVDEKERGAYFGKRNRTAGFVSFISVFIAGALLSLFSRIDVFWGFAILFAIAMVARLVSMYYLNKMYEPAYKPEKGVDFSFKDYFKRLPKSNYGTFVIYYSLLTLATQIAAPFFVVFMLRDLHFSYLTYTILISVSSASTFLSMVYWGKNSDKFGNKKILMICGIIVSIVPALWLVSYSVYYLVFVQIISGFAWAGFNLAAFNFLFDNVKPENRTKCVAYQNVLFGLCVFLGTTIGGLLTKIVPTPAFLISNIEILFVVSTIARLAASIVYLPRIKEAMPVTDVDTGVLFWNLVAVRPIKGLTYLVIGGASKTIQLVEEGIKAIEKKSKPKKKRKKEK